MSQTLSQASNGLPHISTITVKSESNGDPSLEQDELSESEFDSDDPNVFRIRDPLEPPVARTLTTAELHSLVHSGKIDLEPPYQRDVVWSESKQIGLIESIFRNFYVPPVIFAVDEDEDGDEIRVCVDGKQRLTSIQKFMDGQIPHKDPVTKRAWWYQLSEGQKKTKSQIPHEARAIFDEKRITCVEFRGIPSDIERELFQRVQLGVTLTSAEKLQAIDSDWADWISELVVRHVLIDGGLSRALEWNTSRGKAFQNIAALVYCCDGARDNYRLEPTSQKLFQFYSRDDKPPPLFMQAVEDTLREYSHIASNKKLNHGFTQFSQRVSPVEFVFIGVLLFLMRNRGTSENRADNVLRMRSHIRSLHKDVRMNNRVMGDLWDFMTQDLGLKLVPQLPKKLGKKRKLGGDDDNDGDDDYRASPSSKKAIRAVGTRSRQGAR